MRAKRTLDRLTLLAAPRGAVVRDGHGPRVPLRRGRLRRRRRAPGGRPGAGRRRGARGGRARGRRVAAHRRIRARAGRRRATTCSRAASRSAGTGAFRADAGRRATRTRASSRPRRGASRLVRSELRAGSTASSRRPVAADPDRACSLAPASSAEHDVARRAILGPSPASSRWCREGLVLLTIDRLRRRRRLARRRRVARAGALGRRGARARRRRVPRQDRDAHRAGWCRRVEPPRDDGRPARRWARSPPPTARATRTLLRPQASPRPRGRPRRSTVPFSSARKWSGADFGERGDVGARRAGGAARGTADRRDVRRRAERPRPRATASLLLAPHGRRAAAPTTGRPRPHEPVALVLLERAGPARRRRHAARTSPSRAWRSRCSPATTPPPSRGRATRGLAGATPRRRPDAAAETTTLAALVDAHTVFGRITPHAASGAMVGGAPARAATSSR